MDSGKAVTMRRLSTEEGMRAGAPGAPARRWLAVAVTALVFAMLMAGGIVGVSRYVSSFWLYRGFAPPTAPRSVTVHGASRARNVPVILPTLQNITVTSPALGGYPDPVLVLLPPGYASHPRMRYPVLYLLHGFPGQAAGFLNIGQAATTEATLVASGRMKPMIMVMPTGTRSFLTDEEWVNGILRGLGFAGAVLGATLLAATRDAQRPVSAAAARSVADKARTGIAESGPVPEAVSWIGECGWTAPESAETRPATGHRPLRSAR